MKFIRINKKIIVISFLSIILIYLIIPFQWKLIYFNINTNKSNQHLIIPLNPIKTEMIEDTYGAERSGGRRHEGTDIFAPRFTPVVSAYDGIILKIGRDVLGGNIVKIFGSDKRIYYYAHLSSYTKYEIGDKVKQSEVIGFVGSTGNAVSTPPHLHFEIMEIKWLFPLITENINPYSELQNAGIIKMPDSNNLKMDYEF